MTHGTRCVRAQAGAVCAGNSATRAAVLLVLLSVLFLSGCANSESRDTRLVVTGSTTILPIAEIAGEKFHSAYPDLDILVSGLGSSAGIENVVNGTSDIGTSSRDLKPAEMDLDLHDTPIAYDAIAVIVHPDNPVDELSTEELKAIFAGEITNWKDVGGEDRDIGLVNRDEASGTREAFFKIVMGEEPFDRSAAVLPGTGQVRSVVGQARGAVGYISLGFVTRDVKSLSIDGVDPLPRTVISGEYPLQRILHFFTRGEPSGLAEQYIAYVLSTEIQNGVVRDAGFLPIEGRPDE